MATAQGPVGLRLLPDTLIGNSRAEMGKSVVPAKMDHFFARTVRQGQPLRSVHVVRDEGISEAFGWSGHRENESLVIERYPGAIETRDLVREWDKFKSALDIILVANVSCTTEAPAGWT